jgi:hypothetical protein
VGEDQTPQTNGICERFHKTVLDEFYRVASARRSIARSVSCRPLSMLDPILVARARNFARENILLVLDGAPQ